MLHLGTPQHLPYELDEGFDATFERLRRWFRSRGVPLEEAADLAQEAIARALVHLRRHGFDPELGADPLLNTIGRNLLIDRARAVSPTVIPIEAAEQADLGYDPSDEFARTAARRAVRAAIGTLSARHRRAMLLALDGLTPAEIADHFGIQRNAADALLHRVRRRLADQLRTTIGATLGLVAVIVIRARSAARRMTQVARQVDIAASGIVANVATAALAVSIMGVAPGLPATPNILPSDVVLSGGVPSTGVGWIDPAPTSVHDAGKVDSAKRRVSVEGTFTEPVGSEEHSAGARTWYDPDPSGNEGFTGKAIKTALEAVCGSQLGGCEP